VGSGRPEPKRHASLFALGGVTVAAGLYTLACPPYEHALAAWAVPALLLVPTRQLRWAWGFVWGALFSLLMGYGVTGWAYHAALEYFAFNRLLSAGFAMTVWLVYGGIPYGVMLAAYAGIAPRVPAWTRGLLGAWLWLVAEWLRATLLTGMPWELLGHTQFRHLGLVQIADLGGVPAVSFVIALASVCSAEALADRRAVRGLVLPAVLLAATLAYGAHQRDRYGAAPAAREGRTVAVVQGNVPNEFRWKRAFFERTLLTYAGLSTGLADPPDLIVWPENAVNFYVNREPMLLAQLGDVATLAREGLLVGGPRLTDEGEARNSAYLIAPGGRIVDTYDKQHLVPLAEYNPLQRPASTPEEPVYGPGGEGRPFTTASMRVGTLICYEVLFPNLVRDLVRKGADVLVNISNDSWLDAGDGAARRQHFSMAVFRAIETRRFLVRAAATGVSGFITPAGELYATLPDDTQGASVGRVRPAGGLTPYVRWGNTWVGVSGAVLLGILAIA
jgi:apolipoprotein N-acyltransferase